VRFSCAASVAKSVGITKDVHVHSLIILLLERHGYYHAQRPFAEYKTANLDLEYLPIFNSSQQKFSHLTHFCTMQPQVADVLKLGRIETKD
jgi:hypothetical protein